MRANQFEKINMILVQAYPANENLSAGIIQYLNDYFNVHFINLPGFHPNVPAIENYDMELLVRYVETQIEELQLENYILAGISLGFLVVNSIKIDRKNCVAVLASGPFLGHKYLYFSKLKRVSLILMLHMILWLGLEDWIWSSRIFESFLSKLLGNKSKEIIETILKEVDSRAFFGTGLELLKYDKLPRFQDIPYILLINPHDEAINFSKTLDAFWQGIETNLLRVVMTDVAHYPDDPSYEYFKTAFTQNEIESIFNFVEYVSR